MRNVKTLLAALRRAKFDRKGFEIAGSVFTPEDVPALLAELYDVLAAPAVMEYNARHGQDTCGTSSR